MKQKGFGLIGVLLIIGVLVLTAGGVVMWREKIPQTPSPATTTQAPTPSPTSRSAGDYLRDLLGVPGKSWVQIYPKQCMSNPWEIDWFKTRGVDINNCPVPCGQLIDESEAVKEYYAKQGVTIHDIKSISFKEKFGDSMVNWPSWAVCESCDCPRGDTLYLLVSNSDVQRMLDLGYKVAE